MAETSRKLFGSAPLRDADGRLQFRLSDDAELVPPPLLMLQEADEVLEDWFGGGAEHSALLRSLAGLASDSNVLEVGCGFGRLPFALRRVLRQGAYLGIDVVSEKIEFLRQRMTPRYPSFRFELLDVANALYNPDGDISPRAAVLPCADGWADLAVAMSVLTHLLPDAIDRYLHEMRRVLRPGGRCVVSVFLADHYDGERPRPAPFSGAQYAFDHSVENTGGDVFTSDPTLPEAMLAIRWRRLRKIAERAGLQSISGPMHGSWSAATSRWATGQDLALFVAR